MWKRLLRQVPAKVSSLWADPEQPEDWSRPWRLAWWGALALVVAVAILATTDLPRQWRMAARGHDHRDVYENPAMTWGRVRVTATTPDDGLGQWSPRLIGTADDGTPTVNQAYGNGANSAEVWIVPGVYRLGFGRPHQFVTQTGREVRVSAGQVVELTAQLRAPTVLAGRVHGPDGLLAGATIRRIHPSDTDQEVDQTASDDRGRYRLAPFGTEVRAVIEAELGDLGTRVEITDFEYGGATLRDLHLTPVKRVSGRLAASIPPGSATVRAVAQETGALESATVGADGRFRFRTFGEVPEWFVALSSADPGQVWATLGVVAAGVEGDAVELGELTPSDASVVWTAGASPGDTELVLGVQPAGCDAVFDLPVRFDDSGRLALHGAPEGRLFLRNALPETRWDEPAGLLDAFVHDGGDVEREVSR